MQSNTHTHPSLLPERGCEQVGPASAPIHVKVAGSGRFLLDTQQPTGVANQSAFGIHHEHDGAWSPAHFPNERRFVHEDRTRGSGAIPSTARPIARTEHNTPHALGQCSTWVEMVGALARGAHAMPRMGPWGSFPHPKMQALDGVVPPASEHMHVRPQNDLWTTVASSGGVYRHGSQNSRS